MPKAVLSPEWSLSVCGRLSNAARVMMRCLSCLLLLALCASVQAGLDYVTSNEAITITGYSGSAGDVIIPEVIGGYPVSAIGKGAFASQAQLTRVSIPNSVRSIGDFAFSSCEKLGSVNIPSGVTAIGDSVFAACASLTRITIPVGVTNIGHGAFAASSLMSVIIPDSVTGIGDEAFYYCRILTNVTLGAGVTTLGNSVFAWCYKLMAISVDTANSSLSSVDGVLFNRDQTTLMHYPKGRVAASYSIPEGVYLIGDSAFASCLGLTRVVIPDSVAIIGSSAFGACSGLTNVTMGGGLATVGDGAFAGCSKLGSVTLGGGVSTIGTHAFDGCQGLTNVIFPDSLTTIDHFAFKDCFRLTSVTIPSGVNTIGKGAFSQCDGLATVYFEGNQPDALDGIFEFGLPTVYYLPATTGWGLMFGDRPAVLWNPTVSTSDPSFGVREGTFGLEIKGSPGIRVTVEACFDLANPVWLAISTNTLKDGSWYFSDSRWTNHASAVYRFRSP